MDLGAYINIDDETYTKIIRENNIDVPRLRGYRWMGNESVTDIDEFIIPSIKRHVFDDALRSDPPFVIDPYCFEYSERTNRRKKKYGVFEKVACVWGNEIDYTTELVDLKWDKIHGKRRKNVKFNLKKELKAAKKQYDTWNKYVGRKDILYIHARIGGNNWIYYEGYKLEKEPWFLEKVDDYYDNTYCDIYARIKPYDFTEFYQSESELEGDAI